MLDFVRQRELIADGDTGRERHVRQVLAALVRKVHSDGVLADPGRAPAFLDSVARAVTMDSGMLPVLAVARTLDGIDSAHLAGLQVPTVAAPVPTGLTLSQSGRDLMAALAHDDLDDWIAAHRGAVTPA